MKWNILKPYLALLCTSTQLLPAGQTAIKKEPHQLSPRSSFAAVDPSFPILPSRENIEVTFPDIINADYDNQEDAYIGNTPLGIHYAITRKDNQTLTDTFDGYTIPKADYTVSFNGTIGKKYDAKKYGPFFLYPLNKDHFDLNEEIAFSGFDLAKRDAATVIFLGDFIIAQPHETKPDIGLFYRGWDIAKENEITLMQPFYPMTEIATDNYFTFPIKKDSYGNRIFSGVNSDGKPLRFLETGDYLIENFPTSQPGIYEVTAWNKKEHKQQKFKKLVALVNGGQPKKLKEFFLIQLLGEGGQGIVYKAWDPQEKKFVAIKQLAKEFLEDSDLKRKRQNLARFQRDGGMMQQLNHPNIMKVLGQGEEPSPFYIMDCLVGATLDQILNELKQKERALSLSETITLMTQVAKGLEHLHTFQLPESSFSNFVHLDIKPANIFLTTSKEIRIIDFGICYAKGLNKIDDENLWGTIWYQSPEHAASLFDNVDQRSDIYSMGIVLYELLVGKTPFEGASEQEIQASKAGKLFHERFLSKGFLKDRVKKIKLLALIETQITKMESWDWLSEEDEEKLKDLQEQKKKLAPLKRAVDLSQLQDDSLNKIEKIILKATAFDREDRYQTDKEFIQALQSLQKTLSPLLISPVSSSEWEDLITDITFEKEQSQAGMVAEAVAESATAAMRERPLPSEVVRTSLFFKLRRAYPNGITLTVPIPSEAVETSL